MRHMRRRINTWRTSPVASDMRHMRRRIHKFTMRKRRAAPRGRVRRGLYCPLVKVKSAYSPCSSCHFFPIYICVCICIYMCVCIYIYVYIYMHILRISNIGTCISSHILILLNLCYRKVDSL